MNPRSPNSAARAEKRVVRAAMIVHRLWKTHSYFDERCMFDAVSAMDDACAAIAAARPRSRKVRK